MGGFEKRAAKIRLCFLKHSSGCSVENGVRDGGGLNQAGGGQGGSGKWSDRGRIFKAAGMNWIGRGSGKEDSGFLA